MKECGRNKNNNKIFITQNVDENPLGILPNKVKIEELLEMKPL
jgi:hypothetical protein